MKTMLKTLMSIICVLALTACGCTSQTTGDSSSGGSSNDNSNGDNSEKTYVPPVATQENIDALANFAQVEYYSTHTDENGQYAEATIKAPDYKTYFESVYEELAEGTKSVTEFDKKFFEKVIDLAEADDNPKEYNIEVNLSKRNLKEETNEMSEDEGFEIEIARELVNQELEAFCLEVVLQAAPEFEEVSN